MVNLEEATERLQKALARLEVAAKDSSLRRLAMGATASEGSGGDLLALRNENAELQAAIDQASGRLDHTIDHLQKIMEA